MHIADTHCSVPFPNVAVLRQALAKVLDSFFLKYMFNGTQSHLKWVTETL